MSGKSRNLSSNVGFLMMGGFFSQIVNLLTGILLARILLQEDYGLYKQLFLVNGLLTPIFLAAIPTSILFFLPRLTRPYERSRFLTQTIILLSVLGAIFSVTMVVFSNQISIYFKSPHLQDLLIIFSPYPFLVLSASYFSQTMISIGKSKLSAAFTLVMKLFLSSLLILTVLLKPELKIILVVVIIISFIELVAGLYITKKQIGFSNPGLIKLSDYKEQLAFSLPLGLTAIIGAFSIEFSKLNISFFFTPAMYAIYIVGATEIPFIGLLNSSVNSLLQPAISELHKEEKFREIISLWHEAIRKTSLIILPLFVILMETSNIFLTTLYSDKYIESVPIFQIFLFLIPLRVATYGLIVQGMGLTKYNFFGAIFFLILNLPLNLIFIQYMGMQGPAIAQVISTYALSGFYLIIMKRIFKFSIKDLFPLKMLSGNMALALLVGIIVYPITHLNVPKIIILVSAGLTYAIIYITALILTHKLTERDMKLLKNWLSGRIFRTRG